jgi:hypothetical protein
MPVRLCLMKVELYLRLMLWSQFSAIFDDFRRKNWRFSQKPMLCMIQILPNLALFWVKNAIFSLNFSLNFSPKIFKKS